MSSVPSAAPGGGAGPHPERRPVGPAGYWIGGLLVVAGAALAVVLIVVAIVRVADAARFPGIADADGVIELDDTGGRVIYLVGRRNAPGGPVSGTDISVLGPDGGTVPTADYGTTRTVSTSRGNTELEAVAVATFHVDHPGRYRIGWDELPAGARFGVGEGFHANIAPLAFGAAGGLAAVLAGMILLIVTAVRRHRSRRPGPGPGAPPSAWAAPPHGTHPPAPLQPWDPPSDRPPPPIGHRTWPPPPPPAAPGSFRVP